METEAADRERIRRLEETTRRVKLAALESVLGAGKGHLGGSFSAAELLVALYYGGAFRRDPTNPTDPERDRFVLSKAHACNVLYAILADLGYITPEQFASYGQDGALLGGHSDARVPGIEYSGGSLGHGLAVGAGMAWALKNQRSAARVFVMLGDGECQEGSVWEAAMFASTNHLGNLVAIVDRNGLGSEAPTEETAALGMLGEKWRAFNWRVRPVYGHEFESILPELEDEFRTPYLPTVIIADTVKGRGLPYEGTPGAHHTLPTPTEAKWTREALSRVE